MRSTRRRLLLATVTAVALGCGPLAAASLTISPGEPTTFSPVHTACPTFSWSSVDGATGYELVVYEVPEAARAESTVSPSFGETEPALRQTIVGRAQSWTPSTDRCLEMFGHYGWAVRALGTEDANSESSTWSASRIFWVDPGPLVETMGTVLEAALRGHLDAAGTQLGVYGHAGGHVGAEMAALISAALPEHAALGSEPGPARDAFRRSSIRAKEPPDPSIVFVDDVELTLTETGSGPDDYAQLVFDTPAATGNNAWSIAVAGDDATMIFQSPTGTPAIEFFSNGETVIPRLREIGLEPSDTPPSCGTSTEGHVYFDDSSNELCFCPGSGSWQQVDGEGACD